MNIGKSNRGKVGYNFVRRHALVLVPHHDIEDADTVTCDAGLAAANAYRPGNPVLADHDSIISCASGAALRGRSKEVEDRSARP